MPKKSSKNGFFYFMMDFKKKQEELGYNFPQGLADISKDVKCSEEWAQLSEEIKQKYNNIAKERRKENTSSSSTSKEKQTSLGEPTSWVKKQQIAKDSYKLAMENDIRNIIDESDKLSTQELISFYFIHVNYYYHKTNVDSTNDYIPAEFAVCEFTIKNGIKRIYHEIIATEIELGFAREAMEVSDKTHKLYWNQPEGEKNYEKMCKRLTEFLKYDNDNKDKLPPLYTSSEMKNIVPCLLKRMTVAAKMPQDTFALYSLEYLLGSYMEYLNQTNSFVNNECIQIAKSEIDRGSFEWISKNECWYHSKIEGAQIFCSKNIVYQWGYIFCNFCCEKLNVKMIPGIHCPKFSEEVEPLVSEMQNLRLEEISLVKSSSGVSNTYRQKVSSRTQEEEAERRNKASTFTIIDHSKLTQSNSSINSVVSTYTPHKKLRQPKTMIKMVYDHNKIPTPNQEEIFEPESNSENDLKNEENKSNYC